MVPIYDTDVAEERWSKSEWENYELWEKIEQRLKRRRNAWILATAAVFVGLFSIPIVSDQRPKWQSLGLTRQLAQEINALKRAAAIDRVTYRLRFEGKGSLQYRIEKLADCRQASGDIVRRGELGAPGQPMLMLSNRSGTDLGIPGLVNEFCYDPLQGSDLSGHSEALAGFGVLPAADLGDHRLDRLSVLLLQGTSADISFD